MIATHHDHAFTLFTLLMMLMSLSMVQAFSPSFQNARISLRNNNNNNYDFYQQHQHNQISSLIRFATINEDETQTTTRTDSSSPFSTSSLSSASSVGDRLTAELQDGYKSFSIVTKYITMDASQVKAEDIVKLCDDIDSLQLQQDQIKLDDDDDQILLSQQIQLRKQAMTLGRYHLLTKLMKNDYEAYVATASFLSPSRIPRLDLPNVQDVPFNDIAPSIKNTADTDELVDDCTLENKQFQESFLDQLLLKIFRNLVTKNTNGMTSDKDGIDGLLEQGRNYMLQSNQTPEAQHKMVYDTLGGLMTPVLPPFYRVFMSGIVPNVGTKMDGKQIGPWFYAPWLTTIVTPTFFGFLVGPSQPNRRKDGERGGLIVEKCKFLQESNCKGLCLHQCKLPAQQFFKEELGLDLTVSPNFATQECQWSFGEKPLPPNEDPTFPNGCLVGCGSRSEMANRKADSSVSLSCS